MGAIQLLKTAPESIPVPPEDRVSLFIDEDGIPSFKDEADVARSMQGPGISAGGTIGQIISKLSSDDFDTHWADLTVPLGVMIDGGGSVITPGLRTWLHMPYPGTITKWTLVGDQVGSIVVDLWKTTYTALDWSAHPVVGDSITASAKPTITSAVKGQSSTLTGWTTALAAGDILAINVQSVTALTKCSLTLDITRIL